MGIDPYREYGVIKKDSRDDNHNVTSENTTNYKAVEPGDLVVNKMKAWQGSMGVSSYKGIVSPAYITCKITSKKVYSEYLHRLLRSYSYIGEYNRISYGVRIGQWDMHYEDFKRVIVLLPPLEEQTKIANFLDQKTQQIDNAIEIKQKQISLLKENKQIMIHKAVTIGINPDVKLKDSGVEWIGEIPEHWEVKRIKSLSRVKRGASPRPIDDPRYFDENGEFSWVRISDVSNNNHYLINTVQQLSKLGAMLSVKIYPNELFVSIAGTVGKPMISKIKCCIHDGFVYFPDLNSNKEFMYRIFETGQPYLGLGKHGTQLNLNTETIGNIYLPIPPLEEQTKIANFLDQKTQQIDKAISLKEKEIEKLKEYKATLINSAVIGKIKVS